MCKFQSMQVVKKLMVLGYALILDEAIIIIIIIIIGGHRQGSGLIISDIHNSKLNYD